MEHEIHAKWCQQVQPHAVGDENCTCKATLSLLQSNIVVTYVIAIHDNTTGALVVGVTPKGQVELGEGVTLDEASIKFWNAVARYILQAFTGSV